MSIENLLTVGVAAAILVAAAALRLVVLGAARLYLALSGKPVPWLRPEKEAEQAPSERGERRPIARPALNGLGSLGRGLIYLLATLGTWMRGAGVVAARATSSAYASLSPRVASGTQRGLNTAGEKLRSGTIVALASAQHLGGAAAQKVKQVREERSSASGPVEEPADARVIVLDREWDPLTDPLEDEPASHAR